MGSSSWEYFVLYHHDIAFVLRQLRQQHFDAFKQKRRALYQSMSPAEMDEVFYSVQREKQDFGRPLYSSQEAFLLEMEQEQLDDMVINTDAGFHSILDVDHIADHSEEFALSPFPAESLLKLVGTLYPDRQMVEAATGRRFYTFLSVLPGKWRGEFFIIYKDHQPDEWYIFGSSGD